MDRVHISSAPFFFLASTFSLPSLEYNPLKETRRAIRNVIFVSFLFSWRSWIGIKYALFLSLSLSLALLSLSRGFIFEIGRILKHLDARLPRKNKWGKKSGEKRRKYWKREKKNHRPLREMRISGRTGPIMIRLPIL